jgi:alpha-tubulin suppressor-like RCC1 family protein
MAMIRRLWTVGCLVAALAGCSAPPKALPVSPCLTNNGGCDANATCSATSFSSSAICTCREGFIGDGKTCKRCDPGTEPEAGKCVSLCRTNNGGCDVNATCGKNARGITCTCHSGWQGDGKTCVNSHLCEETSGLCGVGTCVDGVGSYTCDCPTGSVAANNTCVDACNLGNGGCSVNEACNHAKTGEVECHPRYASISVGSVNGCSIRVDGTLWCWGDNTHAQVDNSDSPTIRRPKLKDAGTDWASVSEGDSYICGLKRNRTIECWDPKATTRGAPERIGSAQDWSAVTVGRSMTALAGRTDVACGIRAGAIYCWGPRETPTTAPALTRVGTTSDWASVALNYGHYLAIKHDGTLWSWGGSVTVPTQVGTATWSAVSVGGIHFCAIDTSAGLWCWGADHDGSLGLGGGSGNLPTRPLPTLVGADWQAVGAGVSHTCAIKKDGTLWCWGTDYLGELGLGGISPSAWESDVGGSEVRGALSPAQVGTESNWARLAVGDASACAAKTDGTLWCWGRNTSGELAHDGQEAPLGTFVRAETPVPLVSLSVAQGSNLGLDATGQLWGWGSGTFGQLGNGATSAQTGPVALIPSQQWLSVAAGEAVSCGIATDHSLWCWGATGQTVGMPPQQYGGAGLWATVAVAFPPLDPDQECALSMTGGVACWTRLDALAGTGTFVDGITHTDTDWASIQTGEGYACGLKTDQTLWCWGLNRYGQLGIDAASTDTPKLVGSAHWASLSLDTESACGIQADDQSLWCWGHNTSGRLGIGEASEVYELPTPVKNGGAWASVSCSGGSCCALDMGKAAWCWGASFITNVPTRMGADSDWVSLLLGGDNVYTDALHMCGLKTDGKVYCSGNNEVGELGNYGPFANVPLLVLKP